MSGWKVVCLETVKSLRPSTADPDQSDRYRNPNHVLYEELVSEVTIRGESPLEYIQRTAVEDYNAHCEYAHGTVLAQMGGYDANWEGLLEDTHLAWDRAVVIEANDTSDTGTAHVFDRTWDQSRGMRKRALPRDVFEDDAIFHDTEDDAIFAAHTYDSENDDRRLCTTTINGQWCLADTRWVGDWHEFDYDRFHVDTLHEEELRDGHPVGSLAASRAHAKWGVYANANVFEIQDTWQTATTHAWRYRVCLRVDGHEETFKGLFGHDIQQGANVLQGDHLYRTRHEAVGAAAKLGRKHVGEAYVQAVPVRERWTGNVATEFDPTTYPPYDPAFEHPQH